MMVHWLKFTPINRVLLPDDVIAYIRYLFVNSMSAISDRGHYGTENRHDNEEEMSATGPYFMTLI